MRTAWLPETPVLEQALSRACGAPLISGNRVRLLRDADENYGAWIETIKSAKRWIHFETYIIHDGRIGNQFVDLLAAKAREGVAVRFMYDWAGSLFNASRRLFRRLREAGVEVRCFNPPNLHFPFTFFTRDHRKLISVDGRIAFVSGLCVGDLWSGTESIHRDAWRDNGIALEGPAVAEIERAFAESWRTLGPPLSAAESVTNDAMEPRGNIAVRVVPGVPNVAGLYRVDQLLTTFARASIWLEDAYFVGTASYIEALRSAAKAGVDVRLLIPGANDLPVMRALSRAGLRPLLEAGVRVFEWNGSMMHAKTAVVDGHWSRIGSTNLNIASWLNNWEIDVIIENSEFGRQVQEMFIQDLENSTEVVLDKNRPRPIRPRTLGPAARTSAGTKAAGVVRLGRAVSTAIASRELGPAEAVFMFWIAIVIGLLSSVAVIWPRTFAWPFAILGFWITTLLLVRVYKLKRPKV